MAAMTCIEYVYKSSTEFFTEIRDHPQLFPLYPHANNPLISGFVGVIHRVIHFIHIFEPVFYGNRRGFLCTKTKYVLLNRFITDRLVDGIIVENEKKLRYGFSKIRTEAISLLKL